MAHYNEPPATLTEDEWEELKPIFAAAKQSKAFEVLRKAANRPTPAKELFEGEYIYARGQDYVNKRLRAAGSVFALSSVDYLKTQTVSREDRNLALVRMPK